jgi:hypothetical protein
MPQDGSTVVVTRRNDAVANDLGLRIEPVNVQTEGFFSSQGAQANQARAGTRQTTPSDANGTRAEAPWRNDRYRQFRE